MASIGKSKTILTKFGNASKYVFLAGKIYRRTFKVSGTPTSFYHTSAPSTPLTTHTVVEGEDQDESSMVLTRNDYIWDNLGNEYWHVILDEYDETSTDLVGTTPNRKRIT